MEALTSLFPWLMCVQRCLSVPAHADLLTALLCSTASDVQARATVLSLAQVPSCQAQDYPIALHQCPGTTAAIKLSCPTLLDPLRQP